MDYSFGLLKPDAIKRKLDKEIMGIIESAELKVVTTKKVRLIRKEIEIMWPACVREPYYRQMIEFFTSGDSLAFIVKGENAIDRLNKLVGHYDPAKADPTSIRGQFATSCMENLIHSVDDVEKFWLHAELFFSVRFI